MAGHVGNAYAKNILANEPNDLTTHDAPRAKDPVGQNNSSSGAPNRYVIDLLPTPPSSPSGANADEIANARTINRILKALKGVGVIHFKGAPNIQ